MKYSFSLRVVLPLLVLIFILIQLGVSYIISRNASYQEEIANETQALKNRINFIQSAFELFLNQGKFHDVGQLTSSIAADPDMVALIAADYKGNVVASNKVTDVGHYWSELELDISNKLIDEAVNDKQTVVKLSANKWLDGYTSLCLLQTQQSLRDQKCGFIFYRIDMQYHYDHANHTLINNTLRNLYASVIGIALLLIAIHYLITRRTLYLSNIIKRYADGERELVTEMRFNDEMKSLGAQINSLFHQVNEAEHELHDKEQRLDTIFNTVADSIVICDADGLILRTNAATEGLFHYASGGLLGRNLNKLLSPQTSSSQSVLQDFIKAGVEQVKEQKVVGYRQRGDSFPADITISEMAIAEQRFYVCVIRDITERTQMEDAMRTVNEKLVSANKSLAIQAGTDGLTQLANRLHFDRVYSEEIFRAMRNHEPLAMLMCDVDYFKNYNDFYGHQAGDECLKRVANVLSDCFQRAGELVARYGGEEFVVVLPALNYAEARYAAQRVLDMIRSLRIEHEQSEVAEIVTLSIGISCYQGTEIKPLTGEQLLKLADEALYEAKEAGRNQIKLYQWR